MDRYQRRLSGPLRDRFDIGVDVQAVPWSDLTGPETREASAAVRTRVEATRTRQLVRQGHLNSTLEGKALRAAAALTREGQTVLATAVTKMHLSVRGISRVLRVARTLADMARADHISRDHVAEALQFRVPDRAPTQEA